MTTEYDRKTVTQRVPPVTSGLNRLLSDEKCRRLSVNKTFVTCLFVFLTVAFLLAGIFLFATRGEVATSAKELIRIGTSRSEVLKLCGLVGRKNSHERLIW